jgi:hypothetical protein
VAEFLIAYILLWFFVCVMTKRVFIEKLTEGEET